MIFYFVLAAAVLAWYFPVMFFLRSDWDSNSAGKAAMLWSVIVASTMTLAVLRQFGVDLPNWFRAAVYGAIVIGLAVQAVTLTRIQNRRSARIARERESIKETQ